jgi:hypothetical protein
MDIHIDLKDPRYCNGCPCIHTDFAECFAIDMCLVEEHGTYNWFRPAECREKYGD